MLWVCAASALDFDRNADVSASPIVEWWEFAASCAKDDRESVSRKANVRSAHLMTVIWSQVSRARGRCMSQVDDSDSERCQLQIDT